MSGVIISVEGLGKKYRIQHQAERQRYTALRDVITEKAKGLFKKLKAEKLKSGNNAPISASQRVSVSEFKDVSASQNVSVSGPADVSISAFQPVSVSSSEDFWALKDVSFEVKQGEVVGIIGLPREIGIPQLSAFPISAFPILK